MAPFDILTRDCPPESGLASDFAETQLRLVAAGGRAECARGDGGRTSRFCSCCLRAASNQAARTGCSSSMRGADRVALAGIPVQGISGRRRRCGRCEEGALEMYENALREKPDHADLWCCRARECGGSAPGSSAPLGFRVPLAV
jgi:hypothetical protein